MIDGKRLFLAAVVQLIRADGGPARLGTNYPALSGGNDVRL